MNFVGAIIRGKKICTHPAPKSGRVVCRSATRARVAGAGSVRRRVETTSPSPHGPPLNEHNRVRERWWPPCVESGKGKKDEQQIACSLQVFFSVKKYGQHAKFEVRSKVRQQREIYRYRTKYLYNRFVPYYQVQCPFTMIDEL